MREFLSQNQVAFEYHNVDEEPEARQELLDMGLLSTPLTVIDGEQIVGFDRERLRAALDLGAGT